MKKLFILLLISGFTFFTGSAQVTAKEWYNKGLDLKDQDQFKDAINAFKKAVSLQANYADALHQLGWCYNEEGLYNEAIDALKKEEKAIPANKSTWNFEFGYAYKGLKKYDDALNYFNKAIQINPEYALAYKERGNTYYKKPDYEKALQDYNDYRAKAESISDAVYYYQKGWCENELKKYREAVNSLEKCVELDDAYADGYSELGYAYYEVSLNDEAIASYQTAMALQKEKDYHPILGIADVYYDNLKNYDSAIVYYQKGTQIQKKNKTAYYRLGWCYNDKDMFNDAVDPLLQAVLLDPEYNKARTELGYAYYKLERYDDALAQFVPVMNSDNKDELSRYYAGFCYYLKDDQYTLKKMIEELKNINTTNSLKYVETLTKYIK